MNKTPRSAEPGWRIRSCLPPLTILFVVAAVQHTAYGARQPDELMEQLWVEPADISSRDLFHGRGGKALVPDPRVTYRFKKYEASGHSKGYEVEDAGGRTWKVKVGNEAQAEIAVSRILWAIGYHQPVLHYLPRWRMSGGPSNGGLPGRFRLESGQVKLGEWKWRSIPVAGTRPWRGLVIANLLLNNWDLATSNNRVYQSNGKTKYVVQDVGGSLGKTGWPIGTRNDIEDFESQGFVKKVEEGRVVLDYHARHRDLLKEITPADVVWTCRLLSRLTDRQLTDAFRAAGYPRGIRERYTRKIREKIREGLELEAHARRAQ